jgi:FdhE protein
VTQDSWLAKHPYLRPVADLHTLVATAVNEVVHSRVRIPPWEDYREAFDAGAPLLKSLPAVIDFEPVERAIPLLLKRLVSKPLPGNIPDEIRGLLGELQANMDSPRQAVAWLIGEEPFESHYPGLLQYLGWNALARYIGPVVGAFSTWRNEERWLRSYCPTCGAAPAMAQLVGVDPGRLRLLSCGCCETRWRYRRTGCPFCENEDDHRLAVLSI